MKVIGIKFKDGGKIYYFAPKNNETYEEGMEVVVETSKSTEFAVVAFPPKDVPDAEVVQPLKPVVRIATNKDREQVKKNAERKPGAMKIAEEKIRKHNLDMKLIDCEFTFDGTKVIFYFAADGRVDFRELVKDLASVFHIRIELRQVGIRDETRILAASRRAAGNAAARGRFPSSKKFPSKWQRCRGCRSIPGRSAVFAAG